MNTLDTKKVTAQAQLALENLRDIYEKFDILNGHLQELVDVLDKEKYEWFHDFWMKLPTYNEMDDLDQFLTDLKKEMKNNVEED
jgi:hypothetical protein